MSKRNGKESEIIVAEEPGPGWLLFRVKEAESDPSLSIHHCLTAWLEGNPGVRVRAALPIVVKGGMTVAVHLWYDTDGRPLQNSGKSLIHN
jgi:hypothetical protein